jgi:flagellar biosynthesis/type III secretory pathway protein FliH
MECHDCSMKDAVPNCLCGSGKLYSCLETVFGCERCTPPYSTWKTRAETAERLLLELEAASQSEIRTLKETTRNGFRAGFEAASEEARARGRVEGRIEGRKEAVGESEAYARGIEDAAARIEKTVCLFDLANHVRALVKKEA